MYKQNVFDTKCHKITYFAEPQTFTYSQYLNQYRRDRHSTFMKGNYIEKTAFIFTEFNFHNNRIAIFRLHHFKTYQKVHILKKGIKLHLEVLLGARIYALKWCEGDDILPSMTTFLIEMIKSFHHPIL